MRIRLGKRAWFAKGDKSGQEVGAKKREGTELEVPKHVKRTVLSARGSKSLTSSKQPIGKAPAVFDA
jgi:hypothetical protein